MRFTRCEACNNEIDAMRLSVATRMYELLPRGTKNSSFFFLLLIEYIMYSITVRDLQNAGLKGNDKYLMRTIVSTRLMHFHIHNSIAFISHTHRERERWFFFSAKHEKRRKETRKPEKLQSTSKKARLWSCNDVGFSIDYLNTRVQTHKTQHILTTQ